MIGINLHKFEVIPCLSVYNINIWVAYKCEFVFCKNQIGRKEKEVDIYSVPAMHQALFIYLTYLNNNPVRALLLPFYVGFRVRQLVNDKARM